MDQMVRPEGRKLSLVSKCEIVISSSRKVTNWLYFASKKQFMVADDTQPSDQGEIPFPRYTRFNLADIDPTTIESRSGGFSGDYVKRFYDEHPGVCKVDNNECDYQMMRAFDQKLADMTDVGFKTVDLRPAIERGGTKKIEHPMDTQNLPKNYVTYSYDPKVHVEKMGLSFGDQDRPQRFVTAYIHAVSLCGGHGSLFAPTPEKK
jgi:hypothetical protein